MSHISDMQTQPPRRICKIKKIQVKPSFTFVNTQTAKFPDRRAARQHAAYWSKASRRRPKVTGASGTIVTPPESATNDDGECEYKNENLETSNHESQHALCARTDKHSFPSPRPAQRRRKPPSLVMSTRSQSASLPLWNYLSSGAKLDTFQVLPRLQCESKIPGILDPMKATLINLFGVHFVRNVVLRDSEYCSVMFAGCLLLCSAYQFALTGKGSRLMLMRLKDEAIREVNRALSSVDGRARMETLVTVLILGMPIVCLFTNQLPQYLDMEEDITRAERMCQFDDKTIRIIEADISREYETHFAAITTIFRLQDNMAGFLETYEGRFVLVNKMLSNAHRLIINPSTPADAWEYVYEKLAQYNGKGVADVAWNSPLYCPGGKYTPVRAARNVVESHLHSLVQSAQDWLAISSFGDPSNPAQLKERRLKQESLQALLTNDPVSKQPGFHNCDALSIYKACTLTTRIMLHAEARNLPLSYIADTIPEASELSALLRKTDLTNLWGDYKGLLYWVTIICHVTAPRNQFRLTSTTVLAHSSQVFATSHCLLDAALAPLQMLLRFGRPGAERMGVVGNIFSD